MRFYTTLLAGAALVASVFAKPTIDTQFSSVKAGETIQIKYSPATGTAKFVLRQGDPGDLDTLQTLTETATGGTFNWSVPKSMTNAKDYALEIVVDGESNFSGLFAVTGGSTASSSAASSSASKTASMSKTSSASESMTTSMSRNSTMSSTMTTSVASTVSQTSSATTDNGNAPTGSQSQAGPPEPTGNAASSLGSSPLALIFGAVAAMAYLN